MYATHFEPISAREVFPSFDQPDMKGAFITLNIFCHFNYSHLYIYHNKI